MNNRSKSSVQESNRETTEKVPNVIRREEEHISTRCRNPREEKKRANLKWKDASMRDMMIVGQRRWSNKQSSIKEVSHGMLQYCGWGINSLSSATCFECTGRVQLFFLDST